MTSVSPEASSLKSMPSLLAFLAGRPGRRPEGTLAALVAVLRVAVLLAPPVAPAVVLRAAVLVAVFLTAAFLAAGAFSAFVLSPTFTAVLAVLLLAATVLVFLTASSAVRGVLPVTWVIVASVNATALGRPGPTSVAGAELTHRKGRTYRVNGFDAS